MLKVTIKRFETSNQGTFGKLFVGDNFICNTGECPKDHDRDGVHNERNRECIPTGIYKVKPRYSPKFGNHYILENVPNRSYILIHTGNFCGSVKDGYKSHVEGCIILGTHIGELSRQKAVLSSKVAFGHFQKIVGDNEFILEIVEEFK